MRVRFSERLTIAQYIDSAQRCNDLVARMDFLYILLALIQGHLHVVLLPTASNREQDVLLQTDVYNFPAEVIPRMYLNTGQTDDLVSRF